MRDYTSWSEIDTARHCLRKHHLSYKEGWTTKVDHPAAALGTKWHHLLELLYTEGPSAPVEHLRRLKDERDVDCDTLTWMLHGYYEAWGPGDPLWAKNTAFVELEFRVDLPDVGGGPLPLVGVIDHGVWINEKLWVIDHKSSGKPAPKTADLEMADQWTLYVWALRKMGYDVFGSIHNYASTKKLKREQTLEERFVRTPIHRTAREVEAVAREAAIQAGIARSDNGAPRAPGDGCFRRCSFLDVCIADRRISQGLAQVVLEDKHMPKEEKEQ